MVKAKTEVKFAAIKIFKHGGNKTRQKHTKGEPHHLAAQKFFAQQQQTQQQKA